MAIALTSAPIDRNYTSRSKHVAQDSPKPLVEIYRRPYAAKHLTAMPVALADSGVDALSTASAQPPSLSPKTPPYGQPLDIGSAVSSHHFDTNVKYACAACIRGHRTSSCTHKDGSKGPVYPIRSKGRPPTQCETCRRKRKQSGRHVRCDCFGKKTALAEPPQHEQVADRMVTMVPRDKRPVEIQPAISATKRRRIETNMNLSEAARNTDEESSRTSPRSSLHVDRQDHSNYALLGRDVSMASLQCGVFASASHTSTRTVSETSQVRGTPPRRTSFDSCRIDLAEIGNDCDECPEPPRRSSTLSLSHLMNPCGCQTAGVCICCRDTSARRASSPSKCSKNNGTNGCQGQGASCVSVGCQCSSDTCSSKADLRSGPQPASQMSLLSARPDTQQTDSSKRTVSTSDGVRAVAGGCCSGGSDSDTAARVAAPSIELLLQAVDMSSEFVPPPCGCGDNCRCVRCLSKPRVTPPSSADAASAPPISINAAAAPLLIPGHGDIASSRNAGNAESASIPLEAAGCDDCAACDLALERPSGIGAVDSWIEREKDPRPDSGPAASVASSSASGSNLQTAVSPALPRASSGGQPANSKSTQRPDARLSPSPHLALHGGLLTSGPSDAFTDGRADDSQDEVRAELVLMHPNCTTCLEVVRRKGVGVLSSCVAGVAGATAK